MKDQYIHTINIIPVNWIIPNKINYYIVFSYGPLKRYLAVYHVFYCHQTPFPFDPVTSYGWSTAVVFGEVSQDVYVTPVAVASIHSLLPIPHHQPPHC